LVALNGNETGLTADEIIDCLFNGHRRLNFIAMSRNPKNVPNALSALERRGFVARTTEDDAVWRSARPGEFTYE